MLQKHNVLIVGETILCLAIGHFTVMDGSEADGDLVLVQTFLLYYVNQVILMLTSIFQGQFPSQSKGGFYQNKVTVSLTFTRRLGYQVHNCKMVYYTAVRHKTVKQGRTKREQSLYTYHYFGHTKRIKRREIAP